MDSDRVQPEQKNLLRTDRSRKSPEIFYQVLLYSNCYPCFTDHADSSDLDVSDFPEVL